MLLQKLITVLGYYNMTTVRTHSTRNVVLNTQMHDHGGTRKTQIKSKEQKGNDYNYLDDTTTQDAKVIPKMTTRRGTTVRTLESAYKIYITQLCV